MVAFWLFSGLAASLYIFNDLADVASDRQHPFKRKRPIASGKLPVGTALYAAMLLLFSSLALAWLLSFFFFLTLILYALLQLSYTFFLKRVPILDLLSIATGFVLRVYAGAFAVNLHMSVWFLLTVVSASLFLAVGKRQSERTLLRGVGVKLAESRETLSHYTQRLLDVYTSMFANTTWLTYALFAFQHQFVITKGPVPTLLSLLPQTLTTQKWLMATVPVVIYGVMRYLQLVYEQNQGESPERVLLSDKSLLGAVLVWGLMVLMIIYAL